jgi:hypothetical protein
MVISAQAVVDNVDTSQYDGIQLDDKEAQVNVKADTSEAEGEINTFTSNPFTAIVNFITGKKADTPEESSQSSETITMNYEPGSTGEVEGAIDNVKGYAESNPAEIPINGNNDDAKASADEAESYASGKTPQMRITGNASAALGSADAAVSVINAKTAQIKVSADTSTLVNSVSNALSNRTFTANVVANITGTLMNVAV